MKISLSALSLLALAPQAIGADSFPDEIDLPVGFFPEGFAIGKGTTFYAGSLGNGPIYKGDLRTGLGSVIVETPVGFGITSGLSVDSCDRLWVAGGLLANGRVYDADGNLLETYQFTQLPDDPATINDVIVTNKVAYFTDSGTQSQGQLPGFPRLFVVPLNGCSSLPDPGQPNVFTEVILDSDLDLDVAFPNINGIEVFNGGVIVGHTTLGVLLHVDVNSGEATEISLEEEDPSEGPPLPGNDGLVLRGNKLYVVYGSPFQSMVAEVKLSSDGLSGEILRRFPVSGNPDTATTADLFGNAIYAVDARFFTVEDPASATYKVYRTELN